MPQQTPTKRSSKFLANCLRRQPSIRAMAGWTSVLWLLLWINDQSLRFAARKNPSSRVNWLFLNPDNSYDIAILGSSLAKEGLDPELLSSELDRSVIQLAWGGRGVSEQALYWELFLERNRCKTLLLELHPRGLEEGVLTHPFDEFRYLAHLPDPTIERHLDRHFGSLQVGSWKWIPMLAMAQFNTQVGWHDILGWRRGNAFQPNLRANNNRQTTLETLQQESRDPLKHPGASPISQLSVEQFCDIRRLCKKHGVQIIAFAPAIFRGLGEAEENAMQHYQSLLGREIKILAVQQPFLDEPNSFQDYLHLNQRGSVLFTKALAEELEPTTED